MLQNWQIFLGERLQLGVLPGTGLLLKKCHGCAVIRDLPLHVLLVEGCARKLRHLLQSCRMRAVRPGREHNDLGLGGSLFAAA